MYLLHVIFASKKFLEVHVVAIAICYYLFATKRKFFFFAGYGKTKQKKTKQKQRGKRSEMRQLFYTGLHFSDLHVNQLLCR